MKNLELVVAEIGDVEFVCELKFDGTAISLTYHKGELVRAVTRGDGTKGDDITENAKRISNIPHRLKGDFPEDFEIRGEVMMPYDAFDALNCERESQEEAPFANPRNAASGSLKLIEPEEVAHRGLYCTLYHIPAEAVTFDSHSEALDAAASWGLPVSDERRNCRDIGEIKQYIEHWDKQRKFLPFATDGIVIKINELPMQRALGYTAKSPRWAVAYKFKAEQACTRLESISYQVGRTGAITPVANLSPVQLSGTLVKRATLNNEDQMRALDVRIGDFVYVEKGGEIIPKIVGVDYEQRGADVTQKVEFLTICNECGTPLVREAGEAAYYCPNESNCPPQIKGKIEHFVSRKAMNIDGLGSETIDQFYQEGLIHTIADLYALKAPDIARLERMGKKSALNIMEGIRASKDVPFERVLFALGIRFVGETTAKTLAKAFRSIDKLASASLDDLMQVDEIGARIAESIIRYFADEKNREQIERLREAGIQLEMEELDLSEYTDKLAGKSIVISGVFTHHSRDEYKEIIEKNGGKNVGSISKKTSFILAGDNMGPAKLEKANKLGVPIMNEEDFLKLIE